MSISLPCADARRGLVPSGTRRSAASPRLYPGSPPRAVTAPLSPRVAHARFEPRLLSCPHLPPGSPLCAATARYRLAASTPRSEPRLLSARTLRGSVLPASLLLLLSPSAGWGGTLGAAERAGRRNPRFGAARRPPARVSGAGGGECRVDRGRGECPPFGRAAERARSAARASSGHPLAHSAPAPTLSPLSSPSPRSEPRFPSARTLRGSALRSPSASPPGGLAARRPLSFPSPPLSFCRMGCRPLLLSASCPPSSLFSLSSLLLPHG